jgi:non-heme Fe2+,alpha-ketoglutarate-dependent halogenase
MIAHDVQFLLGKQATLLVKGPFRPTQLAAPWDRDVGTKPNHGLALHFVSYVVRGFDRIGAMKAMTTPSFIPSSEELSKLDRDLRFHPSTTECPAALSAEQVAAFNRDGYLAGIRIFEEEEIAGIRRYFDDLLAKTIAAGGDSYSISTAHLRYGRVYDILTDARIVARIKDLIGENVVAWGSHFFCKMPGDGKRVSWHQDSSYWPLTPSMAVTAWLAIDDATVENACMRYIPGSHHLGHLTYSLSENDEANVLNQTVEGAETLGRPVDVELKAGEISIHSDLLLHGSEANESSKRRCGLTLRYCPAMVRADLGWNGKGVVVSGKDESGHWANPPRPQNE